MAGTYRVEGGRQLAADLQGGADRVDQLMELVVEKSAVDLMGLTQRNASGRPGPNAPTGDYRGSWRIEKVQTDNASVSRSVGTDRPQANRLEYGYSGTDSIGRTYDAPPYAHHGPAVDVVEPIFYAAMEKVAEQAVTW